MHLSRLMLTGTTLLALSLVGGCSDDSETPEGDSSPTASTNPTEEARTECEADVKLTGAVKKAWSGEAFVITENRSGPAQYKASKGKITLTVLAGEGSGEEEQPALAIVSAKGQNYTAQASESDTIEADADGASASVDAEARGMGGGKGVTIVASFTC